MTSLSTTTSVDKSKEEGHTGVYPSLGGGLPDVPEKDEDEGAKIAGYERQQVSQEEMDAVGRKIDRRVLPLLAITYFSQFWDKNSLTYSSVMGLPIKGENYNLVSMSFYIGYVISEIPSSALSNRLPMAKYLGVNVCLWATFLMLHACSAVFGAFFAMRMLLGIFESCVSPILIAMISQWYPREQQARKVAVFYAMNGITNMFGGLVAWAVTFYKGDAIAHWRIFYVMQGGLALVVGVLLLLYLPDSIGTAKFLTEREKIVAYERVRDNGTGGRVKKLKRSHAIEAVTDLKTWLLLLLTALFSIPSGGLGAFTSILNKGFGYTSRQTLLLSIPRGFIATCTTITVCWISDKYKQRILAIAVCIIPTILGAALMVGFNGKSEGGSLAGSMMVEMYGSSLAIMFAWTASNTGGSSKKAVVNGMFITMFGVGNIVGTQIFRQEEAPSYTGGKVALLACFSAMLPVTLAMNLYTRRLNKQKQAKLDRLIAENGWTEEDVNRERDKAAFLDLTDRENIFTRYYN
ncbi:hypothetical protein JCM10213_006863 [Rhodosporidiobolus nylandii]